VPEVATCDMVSFLLEGPASVVPTDACDLSLYDALPFFPFGLDAIMMQSMSSLHSLRGLSFCYCKNSLVYWIRDFPLSTVVIIYKKMFKKV
jgi:hypothetical protein